MGDSSEIIVSRTFAEKLDHLFSTVRPRGRGPYSNDEVATAIRATGVDISGSYIWLLRRGDRDNPTMRHVRALAGFFGVPARYFLDDENSERIDAQLALAAELRDGAVRQMAMRAAGLSSESLKSITDVIERVRELEGLSAMKQTSGEEGDQDRPS